MRNRLITLLLISLLLFGLGIPVTAQEPSSSSLPSPQPSNMPELITFSGTGDDVTTVFTLKQGIAIFNLSYDGESNFFINLLDEGGQQVDLLVNTIGAYKGSKAIGVEEDNMLGAKPGNYVMNISAEGNWNVQIQQPQPLEPVDVLPLNFEGTGDSVSPFFRLNAGLTTFTMSHDGSSNFIIDLIHTEGRKVDLLANEIGTYDGKKAVGIQPENIFGAIPGIYILTITADGNWKISVNQ